MFNPKVILDYFRIYKKHIGSRLLLVFVLTLLAVLVEALGITLILPLLTSLDIESSAPAVPQAGAGAWIQDFIDLLGFGNAPAVIIAFIAALVALKGIIRFAADAYGAILSAQLEREIKHKMFQAYSGMAYTYYTSRNTGHFVNILTSQISRLILSFSAFKTFSISLLTTAGYMVIAFLVDWRFALMAVLFGGAVLILFRQLSNYVRNLSRRTAEESGILNKYLVQSMQGFKYLSATAGMAPLAQSVQASVNRLARYSRDQGLAGAFTGATREPVSIIVILIVLVVQLYYFEASIAPILVSLILLYRAMGQVMLLQGAWQHMMGQIGGLELVEQEFGLVQHASERTDGRDAPPLEHGISLQSVSFRYTQNTPNVLHQINLTIPAFKTIALVGPSGAGKSTLVDILTFLLRPTEGSLSIDGLNADDISPASWRRQIGFVSQDTVIFDDTIANNIGMWSGDFANDPDYARRITDAARQAYALDFIQALPDGFNTVVGDRGLRLSGGQKQRLFIARELFKKPRLLILDEATSALDSESERAIQQSIDNLRGHTTIVIIAHRLSTIKNADQVCVLDHGKLIEQGTYQELLNRPDSRFARMVKTQSL